MGLYNYIVITTDNDLENISQICNNLNIMHNNPVRMYSMCMTRSISTVPSCKVNQVQAPPSLPRAPNHHSRYNNATHPLSKIVTATPDMPHHCTDERPHGTIVPNHAIERPSP